MNKYHKNVLVVLANESYLKHAKHLFVSARSVGGWTGDLCLMKFGPKTKSDDWFIQNNIFIYYIEKGMWGDVPEKTEILLSKFHIVHPYMKKWDKLLFLDCDIIINGSLQGLLRFKGHHAVPGILYPSLKDRLSVPKLVNIFKYISYRKFESSIEIDSIGFNGGVYLIDLSEISERTFDDGLLFFKRNKDFLNMKFGDEALMASFFSGRIKPLPLCYNVFMKYITETNGIVLHYLGEDKPWHESHHMYKTYCDNLKLSSDFSNLKPLKSSSIEEIKKIEKHYQDFLEPTHLEISNQSQEEFRVLYNNVFI